MKREIKQLKVIEHPCCPGHDTWPTECYGNNRSKKARSRDKKKEHKFVRTLSKRLTIKLINEQA